MDNYLSNLTVFLSFLFILIISLNSEQEYFCSKGKIRIDPDLKNITFAINSTKDEWPNVLVFTQENWYICNGILVTRSWVLTLQTCVLPYDNLDVIFVDQLQKKYDVSAKQWRLAVDNTSEPSANVTIKGKSSINYDAVQLKDHLALVNIKGLNEMAPKLSLDIPNKVPIFGHRICKLFVWLNKYNQTVKLRSDLPVPLPNFSNHTDSDSKMRAYARGKTWSMHDIVAELSWFDNCADIMKGLGVSLIELKDNLCSVVNKTDHDYKDTVMGSPIYCKNPDRIDGILFRIYEGPSKLVYMYKSFAKYKPWMDEVIHEKKTGSIGQKIQNNFWIVALSLFSLLNITGHHGYP